MSPEEKPNEEAPVINPPSEAAPIVPVVPVSEPVQDTPVATPEVPEVSTSSDTPVDTPAVVDTPVVTSAEAPSSAVSAPAAIISDQWQSKQEYVQAQAAAPAPAQPVPGIVKNNSKFTQWASIAFGVSLLLYLLTMTTDLRNLGSFTGSGGRSMTAYPIVAFATIAVIVSFFLMTISGITTSKGKPVKRTLSIVGTVVGAVLVFNPFSALVLLMLVMCNIQSCSGS